MITIRNLEVRLEVDGKSDRAEFARMFDERMEHRQRVAELEARHRQRLDREREIVTDLYEGMA